MKQIYYLAVNRGFYRGEADYLANLPDAVIFTSNIRRATPFNSFNEAEEMFKKLLNYSTSDLTVVAGYYTVLVTPLRELPSSSSPATRYLDSKGNQVEAASILLDANCCSFEQSLHDANCCCSQEAEDERSCHV